jgi:hypothetical protein
MAKPTWRVGAFAERYPQEARDFGRLCKLEAVAGRMLYESAGVVRSGAIGDASYGAPPSHCGPCGPGDAPAGCCGSPCARGGDSCCDRGSCTSCGPREDDFAAMYPEASAALDEGHALSAAIRDVLTDPDLEDVGGAISTATTMASKGELATLYAPAVPAKKLPTGEDAPARCPVCGATVCPTCGCSCSCCPSAHETPAPAAEPM